MRSVVEQMDQVVRLQGGASAEIDDSGNVTIIQDADHSITLTPERMYELVIWAVECHLSYLDFKAHEIDQQHVCFECREPIAGTAFIHHLDEGDVELCTYCHTDIVQTIVVL